MRAAREVEVSEDVWKLRTVITGQEAQVLNAHDTYCGLSSTQPLLLQAEPDGNVLVSTLHGEPASRLEPTGAAVVHAKLSAGEVLLARCDGRCYCLFRHVLVWSEGEKIVEVEAGIPVRADRARKRKKETT